MATKYIARRSGVIPIDEDAFMGGKTRSNLHDTEMDAWSTVLIIAAEELRTAEKLLADAKIRAEDARRNQRRVASGYRRFLQQQQKGR